MGVVFEAVDQKLGRHVAIKLLIETTHNDRSALERFWREARAASSFNHPGICTIHELNESAETPFIVMELMEGNSLEKLYRGHVMPYSKLLEMGMQLADALDVAHRKGILHRDIKPSNIFVTNSGQVRSSISGWQNSTVAWRRRFNCRKPSYRFGIDDGYRCLHVAGTGAR